MSTKLATLPLLCLVLAGCAAPPAAREGTAAGARHLPSPDWRDQVIYFAMIDRFDDGDPRNNDQGQGEYDPSRNSHYSGGDLAGITRRLDYIQSLGATTLWITPPVTNQWWNPERSYTGYHGYWAADFKSVDPHYGTLADYQHLSQALHARGMYLVQDIVVNHVGNWFGYDASWQAGDPVRGYVGYAEQQRGGGRGAGDVDCRHDEPYRATDEGHPDRLPAGQSGAPPPLPPAPCPASPAPAPPFHQNDPRDPAQRAAAIYHWTPDIRDYQDPVQEADWQMGGLDDLNTENPVVRRALRDAYGHWIREVGVDGFRIDTIFYVPPAFFDDFLHAEDPAAPGIDAVARATGRERFLSFGEGFAVDPAFRDDAAHKIDRYLRREDGGERVPGMINFPLYGSLGEVFARGRPTAELAHRIESMMRIHPRPHLNPSFLDNHDVDRFLAGGSEAGLKQALLAMLTLPGIPVIYYGTEQGLREQRAAMFASGYGSGGRDQFDTQAPLYRFLKDAIALRRAHPVLSRGTPELLASSRASAGALAWRMRDGDEQLIVVFNTAEEAILVDHLATGLAPGTSLATLFAQDESRSPVCARSAFTGYLPQAPGERLRRTPGYARETSPDHGMDPRPQAGTAGVNCSLPAPTVSADGTLSLVLPPRSAYVWQPQPAAPTGSATAAGQITIDPPAARSFAGDFELSGRADHADALQLVIDGQLGSAQTVAVAPDGRWRVTVDTGAMLDPSLEHRLVLRDPASGSVSPAFAFQVQRPWRTLADIADPKGDDHGPDGRYRYPTDPAWREARPADIEHVRVEANGGALRLTLTLHQVIASWNPPNGFDHVALTAYVQLPGREGGASVMPLQQGELPDGMRWHYRVRAGGWAIAGHRSDGASATNEGTPVTPTPGVAVDRAARTLTLTLPAAALGNPASHAGTRIYLSTWDYDGGYRALTPEPGAFQFGGGPGALVMDSVVVEVR